MSPSLTSMNPRKLMAGLAVAGILSGAALLSAPGTASAAHCVAPATEETASGFSYFGTDHVKLTAHDREGGNPGPHAGTSGASNCRETTGSPSVRAPGQN